MVWIMLAITMVCVVIVFAIVMAQKRDTCKTGEGCDEGYGV